MLGLSEAIERGNAYAEAGADVIFVEAPRTVAEIALIAREIAAPKLINVVAGGLTPEVDPAMLRDLGYSVAIYPTTALLAATNAAWPPCAASAAPARSRRRPRGWTTSSG